MPCAMTLRHGHVGRVVVRGCHLSVSERRGGMMMMMMMMVTTTTMMMMMIVVCAKYFVLWSWP